MKTRFLKNIPLHVKGFKAIPNSKGLVFYSNIAIALRQQLKEMWYSYFCSIFGQFLLLESPIIIPLEILKNSGHLQAFSNINTGEIMHNNILACRPETCQSVYCYYKEIIKKDKQLFIVGQIGNSCRLEKTTQGGINRLTEFTQLEIEIFNNEYPLTYLSEITVQWFKLIGLHVRTINKQDLPHYSKQTIDIEYLQGTQWVELASISDRGNHDLKPLNINISEISIGLDRVYYALFLSNDGFSKLKGICFTDTIHNFTQLLHDTDNNLLQYLDKYKVRYQDKK